MRQRLHVHELLATVGVALAGWGLLAVAVLRLAALRHGCGG